MLNLGKMSELKTNEEILKFLERRALETGEPVVIGEPNEYYFTCNPATSDMIVVYKSWA